MPKFKTSFANQGLQTHHQDHEDAPESIQTTRPSFRYVIDDGIVIMESELPEGIPAYLESKR
jgi:hypothetical protein